MSFLKEIGKRKPIHEGRGVKVFRLVEEVEPGTVVKVDGIVCKVKKKLRHFSHEEPFYICVKRDGEVIPARESDMVFEGWGWEDVWQDMKTDKSIRRLQRDVVRMLRDGTPIGLIEDNLDHLIDKASTRLTTEEKVVFLKWLEKNKKRLTPELGLDAYNRSRRSVTESRYQGNVAKGTPIRVPFPRRQAKWSINKFVKELNDFVNNENEHGDPDTYAGVSQIHPDHITPDVLKFANARFDKLHEFTYDEEWHMDEYSEALEDIIKYITQ
jgi:hypothetical protein